MKDMNISPESEVIIINVEHKNITYRCGSITGVVSQLFTSFFHKHRELNRDQKRNLTIQKEIQSTNPKFIRTCKKYQYSIDKPPHEVTGFLFVQTVIAEELVRSLTDYLTQRKYPITITMISENIRMKSQTTN